MSILKLIVNPILLEQNAIIKNISDDEIETLGEVLVSMVYDNPNDADYLHDENIPQDERGLRLFSDVVEKGITNEELQVMGLPAIDNLFPLPFLFIDMIDIRGVNEAVKAMPIIEKFITSDQNVEEFIRNALSVKIFEKGDVSEDTIHELIEKGLINLEIILTKNKDFLTLENFKRYEDKIVVSDIFSVVEFNREVFEYLDSKNAFENINNDELTVCQPAMILEDDFFRNKYFDRIVWEKALIKRRFSEEILENLIQKRIIDWGNCAIYQVLSKEFEEKYAVYMPFKRGTICWNRDIIDTKLHGSVVQEDYETHATLDEEIEWNDFILRHPDKVQIGWIAAVLVAKAPIMDLDEVISLLDQRLAFYKDALVDQRSLGA